MPRTLLLTIGGVHVYGYNSNGNANALLAFESGLNIDADGSPKAYNPQDTGLDYLANAGENGNWWALATDASGNPVVQGPNDPSPGNYVSTTALSDGSKAPTDPTAYVDSETIPYVALPPRIKAFFKLGDIGYAYNTALDVHSYFIFADIGPGNNIGEGSMQLAENLGINDSPKKGGVDSGVIFLLFPGTGDGKVKTAAEIQALGDAFVAANDITAALADFGITA